MGRRAASVAPPPRPTVAAEIQEIAPRSRPLRTGRFSAASRAMGRPQVPVTSRYIPLHIVTPVTPVTSRATGRSQVIRDVKVIPLRPVTYCYTPSRPVTSRHVPSRPITSRHVPLRPVITRHVPLPPVTSRYVPSRPVVSPGDSWGYQSCTETLHQFSTVAGAWRSCNAAAAPNPTADVTPNP